MALRDSGMRKKEAGGAAMHGSVEPDREGGRGHREGQGGD
jgi:hypothetical protein